MAEKLISRKDAAKILGISLLTLDSARANGLISYVQYKENGRVFFTESAIEEYIARSTHKAKPQIVNTGTVFRKNKEQLPF